MPTALNIRRNAFGYLAMACGSLAVALAVVHFWAGPLEPQPTLERSIAEIAVNISREVVNVVRDKPAELQHRVWDIDDIIRTVAPALGVLALVLAAIGFVRREDHRPARAAGGLGGSAIAFQFVTWLALVACGLVIIWIIVANLGEILSAG